MEIREGDLEMEIYRQRGSVNDEGGQSVRENEMG